MQFTNWMRTGKALFFVGDEIRVQASPWIQRSNESLFSIGNSNGISEYIPSVSVISDEIDIQIVKKFWYKITFDVLSVDFVGSNAPCVMYISNLRLISTMLDNYSMQKHHIILRLW